MGSELADESYTKMAMLPTVCRARLWMLDYKARINFVRV
jgi:hypothetical protein